MGTDVAKVEEKSTALAIAPELLAQFGQYAGAGTESMTNADKAIPFIGLVQSMSPQRKKDNPKYIPGAEEGDIFNTVTRELFKGPNGILVIPVDFQKVYNVWIPRDEGGGFLGSYADAELKQPITTMTRNEKFEGTPQVTPTANHFVLVQSSDGSWQQALLSMKSTQLTISRKWASQMSMVFVAAGEGGKKVPAPTFAKAYRIKSTPAKNDKGEYYNYVVEDAGWVDQDAFQSAVEFRTSLKAGKVQVDYTKADEVEPASADKSKDDGDLSF